MDCPVKQIATHNGKSVQEDLESPVSSGNMAADLGAVPRAEELNRSGK